MWSKIVVCLFVATGLVCAASNPAWSENKEYRYQIRGRTLTSLDEVGKNYAGVILKAKMTVRPRSDGKLNAKIYDAQYSQVHAQLEQGWTTDIPESQLAYKQLPISEKPFQIEMNNGAVRNLIVSKDIKNWEANIIKSIVSQFQLDTKAENLVDSYMNALPQEDENTAVFKTMEHTVTGISETLYEIHPMPEYILESKPWLAPLRHQQTEGHVIEIVKSKNFSRSEERPSYHYGFEGIDNFEPSSNKMGEFLSRTSLSRAVVTGNLNKYTIQNSYTVNEVAASPTLADKQKGFVRSMVNITIESVKPAQTQDDQDEPQNSVSLGSLVYRYSSPNSQSNHVRPGKQYQPKSQRDSSESASSSNEESYQGNQARPRRSTPYYSNNQQRQQFDNQRDSSSDSTSDSSVSSEEYWQQEQFKINEAPLSPLLPLSVGYEGESIKKQHDIVKYAQKLTQEIAEAMKQQGQSEQYQEQYQSRDSQEDNWQQNQQQRDQYQDQNQYNHYRNNVDKTAGQFVLLTAITRLMNEQEIQQTAAQVYSKEQEGTKRDAWVSFRDAVAQAGTGPALLTIQDWIKTKKIDNNEAATLVSTAANAARQPTEEYMRSFYQMVKTPEVMSQSDLNETVLMAFTDLSYKVYVDEEKSHSRYPSHSFGAFRTESGRRFLKNEVIPHLTEQLHSAISRGDAQQIHTYIRALGNTGHQKILAAFEPYLEGQKQASHFQRVLMVMALDKITQSHEKLARSVMYKIYQNPAEFEQVRVAAVYQLMRTAPPADMLQRMAQYTNTDESEYVNAAVKSSIENAAKLQGKYYQYMRDAAESAKPMLTKKEYGIQYTQNMLRGYVVDEMKVAYKQAYQTFNNGFDTVLPSGFRYSVRSTLGGVRRRQIDIHAITSSIDDLTEVFKQQTESRQQHQHKQQQTNKDNDDQYKWASENIAQYLNMESAEREQLENYLYVQLGSIQKTLSFDNRSIEQLPQVIRQVEQELRGGKKFHYTHMENQREMVLSFPTEMGMPFIFTYDSPVIVSFKGKVHVEANPEMSNGKSLNRPEKIQAVFEVEASVTAKTQGQLGFISLHDNQRYSAGYDKKFQIYAPVNGRIAIDTKEQQIKTEFQVNEKKQDTQLFHFSTEPYTSQNEISQWYHNKKVIRKQYQHQMNTVVGAKATGIAVEFHATTDQKMDALWLMNKLQRHDAMSALLGPWIDENIQYTKVNAKVNSQNTSTKKMSVRLDYQSKYQARPQNDDNDSKQDSDISSLEQISEEPSQRQAEYAKKVARGIFSADVKVFDAQVEFQGSQDEPKKYRATVASARSDVDPKSRLLAHIKRSGNHQDQDKKFQIALSVKSHIPNTNGLNMEQAMEFDSASSSHVQLAIGENLQEALRFEAQVQARKSETRQQYLKQHPQYKQCQKEMQQGNKQLPACAKMTEHANLLDHIDIKIQSPNIEYIDERTAGTFYYAYDQLRRMAFPNLQESKKYQQGSTNNQVEIQARFSPDLSYVNVSIKGQNGDAKIADIRINEYAQQILVPHPVFHAPSRLVAHALKRETYRQNCVVDKTVASTFNKKNYPINLSKHWTVMMQYVPHRPAQHNQQGHQQSVKEQLQNQVENYVVYTRASQQNPAKKDVKINLRAPETQGKHIDITMQFSQEQQQPKVQVNGQVIKYNAQMSSDIAQGYIKIYALPYGEVKVQVNMAFYVIYDGSRAKLTVLDDDKFRNSVRGICGQNNGEQATDFQNPQNCIVNDAQDFVTSYTVQDNQQQQQQQGNKNQCHQRQVEYANVISEKDAGRQINDQSQYHSRICTKHQTRYVAENNQICFTLRPVPVCKSECKQKGTVSQNVPVHCVAQSNASHLWRKQIDKGASPDFSLKSQTKTIRMEIPQRCSP